MQTRSGTARRPSSTGASSKNRHRSVIIPSRAQGTGSIVFARTLKGMPIVLSRPLRPLRLLALVLLPLAVVPPFLLLLDAFDMLHLDVPTRYVVATVWLYVAPCLCCLLFIAIYWRVATIRSLVRKSNHELCTRCGYSLSGLPERHNCPECGEAYDLEYVRRCWKSWAG